VDSLRRSSSPANDKYQAASVARINHEQFNGGTISSAEQLIQGRVAGVQINSVNADPGG